MKLTTEQRELLSQMGREGGSAKVPKGFAKLTKKQRSANARRAAKARWRKRNLSGEHLDSAKVE